MDQDTSTSSLLASNQMTVEHQKMSSYERDIPPFTAAIVELDHNQYSFKTRLNATSSFLAKLPVEIISEVFDLVNESQSKSNTRLFPAPLLLGKICKAWRHIAWTRPRLWSFVSICLKTTDKAKISNQEQLLREWLLRCRNYLLHHHITYEPGAHPTACIAKLLFETCSQWKSLMICPFPALVAELEKGHFFPNLSYVQINGRPTDNFDRQHFDFSKAPQLRKFKFSGINVFPSTTICWEQLTMVNMSLPSHIEHALPMIKRLKVVQRLRLRIYFSTHIPPDILPHNLPELFYLEILSNTAAICSFLNAMTTPLLTTLKITPCVPGDGSWALAIEQLHQRSHFSLTRLSLDRADIGEKEMLAMLESLASLCSFSLFTHQKFKLSDAMITRLNPSHRDPDSYFLPVLTEFDYSGPISFTINAIEGMLEQRLLFSQSQDDKLNKVKALQDLNITYTNSSWIRKAETANPNQLQAFYQKINDLEARGTTLSLVQDQKSVSQADSH